MEWTDDAIVLSARPHGETGAILELLTRDHGRHLGLVRGGASRGSSRRCSPATACMCTGGRGWPNIWAASPANWRGPAPATLMDSRDALAGLNAFTAVAVAALPEREAHAPVFEAAKSCWTR